MKVLIGADPELFVLDAAGRNVSGHDMIPGTKKEPHKVRQGAVQVDGTALEFNIDPAETEEAFVSNVRAVLDQLKGMIPPGHHLDLSAVARYEEAYFESLPKFVKAMGCDPDFDAYTGIEIEHKGVERPFRTASGHVHVGWTQGEDPYKARHYQSCRTLVKELDLWLGVPSVIFDPESQDRRQLYGTAGAFRPKPYGAEYRVLSNKWLQSEQMMRWVFTQTQRAFAHLMSGQGPVHRNVAEAYVRRAINEGDVAMAKSILMDCAPPELVLPDGTNPRIEALADKPKPKKKVVRVMKLEEMLQPNINPMRVLREANERAEAEAARNHEMERLIQVLERERLEGREENREAIRRAPGAGLQRQVDREEEGEF